MQFIHTYNIFYHSCSQQEAYEEPGQENGLYALHLLKHIRRNERIELILMDVARGMFKGGSYFFEHTCLWKCQMWKGSAQLIVFFGDVSFMDSAFYIFTDVSIASNRNLIQRPCHESDAVADCRLTDPIVPNVLPEAYVERMKLWNRAHSRWSHISINHRLKSLNHYIVTCSGVQKQTKV